MARALTRKAAETPSIRQKTYQELKDLILTGQLRPSERISESRLAERIGVSRTPLREALMKLEKEGLVVGQRNVGYSVADFDLQTICDLLVVREALDVKAAEIACETATDDDLARIRAIITEMETLTATASTQPVEAVKQLELGLLIHRVIAEATRNVALIRFIDQIYEQLQVALLLEIVWVELSDLAITEHTAIAEAIYARDPVRAAAAARAHVQSSLDNLRRIQKVYALRRAG